MQIFESNKKRFLRLAAGLGPPVRVKMLGSQKGIYRHKKFKLFIKTGGKSARTCGQTFTVMCP